MVVVGVFSFSKTNADKKLSAIDIQTIPTDNKDKEKETTKSETENEESTDFVKNPSEFDEGYIPDNAYSFDSDYKLNKSSLVSICMDSLYKIPFVYGGRCYTKGYLISKNPDTDYYNGVDSVGYLIWAYRQLQGYTPTAASDPLYYYEVHPDKRVNAVSELQVGDIGMVSLNKTDNSFGIFIGFYMDNPVFVHCSNEPHLVFEKGCVRLSYLKSVCDAYLEGSRPVDYKYFIRPDVEWLND